MSELMLRLRDAKPECRGCINAIRFRAELVAYGEEVSASEELVINLYIRGLRCTGLISLITNDPDWLEERIAKDEAEQIENVRNGLTNNLGSPEQRSSENLLIEIPEPQRVKGVTRSRVFCPLFPV